MPTGLLFWDDRFGQALKVSAIEGDHERPVAFRKQTLRPLDERLYALQRDGLSLDALSGDAPG